MIDAGTPNRSDVYKLIKRVATDIGCVKVIRGFHQPKRNALAAEYPLMAVIFDDPDDDENHSSGGRTEIGIAACHLWVKEGTPSQADDLEGVWGKVDAMARAFKDRLDHINPAQGVTGSDLIIKPKRGQRDFFLREEAPFGCELEIEYTLHTIPPAAQSPGEINILND